MHAYCLALLLGLFLWALPALGQLRVDDGISVEEAIKKLIGQGVKISNVQVSCPTGKGRPWGYFTDNTGTLGIPDGLLITTGAARNAVGPNNSASVGQVNNKNEMTDPDLAALVRAGEKLYDVCAISFDVQVFSDSLIFEYIFGSEEYPEFVRDYHDVFGFFISGPGIVGRKNIALIPGTNDPVSVGSVNDENNTNYYINNGTGSTPFINLFVQYDGYTTKLTSKVAVQPCEVYRLKLAICDVRDPNFDAGIFIEGRSLRTKSPMLRIDYQHSKYKYGIEGCNNARLIVTRQSMIGQSQLFILKKSGTATPGQDYSLVPDSVFFNPGESEKTFPIQILQDDVVEPAEFVTFQLLNPCAGLPEIASTTLTIQDAAPYNAPDDSICIGQTVLLNPKAPADFSFVWATDSSLSCTQCASPLATPTANTAYYLAAIDNTTGCISRDTLQVKVLSLPQASFTYLNPPDYTNLDFQFVNQSTNAEAYYWQFGDGGTSTLADPMHSYRPGDFTGVVQYHVMLTAIRQQPYCTDTSTAIIELAREQVFSIPNLVTANGDDLNDTFHIRGIQPGHWSLEIRNRFGKKVYEHQQYDFSWNGREQPAGLYYYILKNRYNDRIFKGWITLVK